MQVACEVRPVGPLVGEGPLPRSLDRLNWGALLLPVWWALVHGVWGWFVVMTGWWILGRGLSIVAYRVLGTSLPLRVLAYSAISLIGWVVVVPLARRANALFWIREGNRMTRESDQSVPRSSATVEKYTKGQRTWAIVGLVAMAYGYTAGGYLMLHRSGATLIDLSVDVAVNVAVLAVLYLWDRQRSLRLTQS